MKQVTLLLVLLTSFNVFSMVQPSSQKNYSFRFQPINGEAYTYETTSISDEEAYERAATACFNHYKKGRRISTDEGLDIIDVCANPRNM